MSDLRERWPELSSEAKQIAVDAYQIDRCPRVPDVRPLATLPERWPGLSREARVAIWRALHEADALVAQALGRLEAP